MSQLDVQELFIGMVGSLDAPALEPACSACRGANKTKKSNILLAGEYHTSYLYTQGITAASSVDFIIKETTSPGLESRLEVVRQ